MCPRRSSARTCAKYAVGLLDLVAANYSANHGCKHMLNAVQCHQCAEPAQVISTASKAHGHRNVAGGRAARSVAVALVP